MRPGGKGVQESGSRLGYTVGDSSSDTFMFILDPEIEVKKWEYVYLLNGDSKIVGRVEKIISRSELLNSGLDFNSVSKYVTSRIGDNNAICYTRTLGTLNREGLALTRELINPGTEIFRAEKDLLENIFGYGDDESLHLGFLADRPDVKVNVNVNGLRRHLAIVAQTGAGKSHTAGVLMEELLKKGATILVLDPHADYVLMQRGGKEGVLGDSVKVFRTPLSTGRYSPSAFFAEDFMLRFQDMEADDLSGIMGIKESWTNLNRIVDEMVKSMSGKKDMDDFMRAAKSLEVEDQRRIAGRLRFLEKIKNIFGDRTTGIGEYLAPGQMSILDLSGMDQFLANYFSFRILNEIYDIKATSDYKYPVFVFIEEAHNFVPPKQNSQIAGMIKKIASEGRKFGIFLVVITQRPGKIDQDVLSQCNSEIILRITNPLDQNAVLESGESISQAVIDDLPSLNVGEAVLVGEFVKLPVVTRVRARETREGGGDVDLVSLLKEAREERRKKSDPAEDNKRIRSLLGD